MNTSLATFMKIALTATVIAALIFAVAYRMLEDESDKYKTHIETHQAEALQNAVVTP